MSRMKPNPDEDFRRRQQWAAEQRKREIAEDPREVAKRQKAAERIKQEQEQRKAEQEQQRARQREEEQANERRRAQEEENRRGQDHGRRGGRAPPTPTPPTPNQFGIPGKTIDKYIKVVKLALGSTGAERIAAFARAEKYELKYPDIKRFRPTKYNPRPEPSDRELQDRAANLLNSGVCGSGTLYHVAQARVLDKIARDGLTPSVGAATFDDYATWSQGKLFLAGGDEAAAVWLITIARKLTPPAKGAWKSNTEAWAKQAEQLVLLRLTPAFRRKVCEDWQGNDTHECSFYTTQAIPAKWLEYAIGLSWQNVLGVASGEKEDFGDLEWRKV